LLADAGASLIEVQISLLIFLLLGGGMVRVTIQNQHIFAAQEEVVATQQDARGSLFIMADALYGTGCGVPARLADPGATGQNVAVLTATATSLSVRGCFSDPPVRTSLATVATLVTVPAVVGVEVDTVANFAVGQQIFLYSGDRWAYGSITQTTAGPPAVLTVNFAVADVLPATFAAGSRVHREEIMAFALNGGQLQQTFSVPPAAGQALQVAPNVTTLQLTYWDSTGIPLAAFPLSLADRRLIHGIGIDLTLQTQAHYPGSTRFVTIQQSTAVQPRNLFAN
jgi:hypothetical protein